MTLENQPDRLNDMSPVKRALYELREMRVKLDALEQARHEPVATIGMGCRFPGGVESPDDYWKLLIDGVDAIREVPPERWDVDAYYDPDPDAAGKISTRWGGFLEDIDKFEPQFFGISPREAEALDPQQRLLLEVAWEALEHAGQSPDRLVGAAAGVYVGIAISDYLRMLLNGDREDIDVYLSTGGAISVASGRLSYFLGLQGPALSIDTACSSSLAAVHLAVQSLRSRECNLALAGGVNAVLLPEILINFSRAGMVSQDGRCKTFDARADGFVRSEGCGVVVLKRLSDALAGRDNILAVIRGTAANQDGRSSGLTAPNGPSQEAVIRSALADAGILPRQVGYVEAHGTGTNLGDPIEVQALAAVLGQERAPDHPLQIGSVKTNLGHLETAAGVAGLMKAVLVLQNKEIPPHLHLQEPNPHIPWTDIPVEAPTERRPLQPIDGRWIAGVSSFGFSGTNVHVVLEAVPARAAAPEGVERAFHLLTLSAKQPDALRDLVGRCMPYLEEGGPRFEDVCYTSNAGRAHLSHRLAVVAESAEGARQTLSASVEGESPHGLFSGQVFETTRPEVAFLFTGHGAQYAGMARVLYETQPTFRSVLDECSRLSAPYLEHSLLSALYDPERQNLMERMAYAQPVLFSIEYALAKLWASWGVRPSVVVGHSLGENAAACFAGAFSLEDGLKIVAARGRLMDALPERGEMAAVFAGESVVAEVIAPFPGEVSIAAINGPNNTVISGSKAALQRIIERLKAMRVKSQRLAVAQAAHSPLLDPMLAEYENLVAQARFQDIQVDLISTVTGKLAGSEELASPDYWRRQIRQPVRFGDAMHTLDREGYTLFVEIGPNPTLLALGRRCLPDRQGSWLPSLRQGWHDWQVLLESLAELYVQGVDIDWEGFDKDYSRRRVPIQTYPWQRERYWARNAAPSRLPPAANMLWDALLEAGRQQEQHGPLDLRLETYPDKWEQLERLSAAYIVRALRELGVYARAGESHSAASLISGYGLLPAYRKLLQRWLERLEKGGLLSRDGERFTNLKPLDADSLMGEFMEKHPALGDISILVDYVKRSGEKLVPLLKGAENPLDLLFHESPSDRGSFGTADFIYRTMPLLAYYNGILAALVRSMVREISVDRKLAILETGAGTGGTTSYLLPVLPPERTRYQFSDVSDLFLNKARDNFERYPFVRYGLLDINLDPQEQGFRPGYDLIVAANVLHAAKDLPAALGRIRSLLAPGGLLMAFEVTEHLAWFDVTTALIESLGTFEDDLRRGTPFLTAAQWEGALSLAGFERVAVFPGPGSPAEILGSRVFLAQNAGETAAGFASIRSMPGVEPEPTTTDSLPLMPVETTLQDPIAAQLESAMPIERRGLLIAYVRSHLSAVLRLPQDRELDRRQRLVDLGVDSLMAVELKNRLQNGLDLPQPLPSTLVYDYPTIEAVAVYLEDLLFVETDLHVEDISERFSRLLQAEAEAKREYNLADLPEAEVEKLLLKKLQELKE